MLRRRTMQALYALAVAGAVLCPAVAHAQMDVTTLKKIAEAADGVPGGGTVFVVVNPARDVIGVPRTRAEAEALVGGRPDFVIFPIESRPAAIWLPVKCVHLNSNLRPYCNSTFPQIRLSELVDVRVSFRLRSGQVHTVTLPPDADALFLSSAAFEKFAFPYYARVYGVDSAFAMRRSMVTSP